MTNNQSPLLFCAFDAYEIKQEISLCHNWVYLEKPENVVLSSVTLNNSALQYSSVGFSVTLFITKDGEI